MSFVKLFGSILDSTVWREGDHVVRVWIAILALKDADGIVEMSIPGLADRARRTIAETEDALRVLMSPDPYSTTPDHEGRRIERTARGWKVLNHALYRDMMNAEEQREKKNARQKRWRDKEKDKLARDVDAKTSTERLQETPVDARRREEAVGVRARPHTDTDTDPDRARGGSDPGSTSSPASSERSGDRIQAAGGAPSPEARMLWPIEQRIATLRRTLAAELGMPVPRHPHPTSEDRDDALARLRESGQDAAGDLDAVFAEVEREARASNPPSLEFVSWSMFRAKTWSRKLARHGAIAAPSRAPLAAGRVEPKPAAEMDQRKPWEIPREEIEAERARVAAERGGRR